MYAFDPRQMLPKGCQGLGFSDSRSRSVPVADTGREGIKVASPLRAGGLVRVNEPDAADEIRRSLARELHDRVAQTLTSMLIELENFKIEQTGNHTVVREVIGLQQSTRDVLNNLRHVLYDLRGQAETDETFVDTVRSLVIRFQEKTQVRAVLSVSPSWPENLRPAVALNLLRIVEEALTNVRLHSDARLVEVVLGAGPDGWFFVEVTDDGRGSDSDLGERKPGLGVLGMRERALILGARLDVHTVRGGGTSVRASLQKGQMT